MKSVSKEFLKNFFSFSKYRLLKGKNSAGQSLGFHRFLENIVWRFLSVTSLMIFTLESETDLHTEHKDFVSSEPGSQKVYLEDFYGIFRSLPCGTSRNKKHVDLPDFKSLF